MNKLIISIGLIIFSMMGFTVCLWYQSASRMQDEYIYALDVGNVLFDVRPEPGSELGLKLNKLLLAHLNRFVVSKQYVPSVLVSEIEELFCGSFNPKSEGMSDFSEVASNKTQQYLEHATSYCPYE